MVASPGRRASTGVPGRAGPDRVSAGTGALRPVGCGASHRLARTGDPVASLLVDVDLGAVGGVDVDLAAGGGIGVGVHVEVDVLGGGLGRDGLGGFGDV